MNYHYEFQSIIMMAFAVKCFYLFSIISSVSSLDEHYIITRADSSSHEVDEFKVPDSQCTSVSQCSDYNGAQSSATGPACTCRCLPTASTFGRHKGSYRWSCMNNTEIRVQSGCNFRFTSEHDGDAFRILKKNENPLPTAVLPSRHCSIDMSSSKYFTCDGTWAELNPNGTTTSPLKIAIKRSLSSSRHYKYSFKVTTPPASIKGKLISLQLKCPPRFQSSCLVFKIEGEFKCLVTITQASTTKTPMVKSTTIFTTSAKPSKTQGVAEEAEEEEEEEGKEASNRGERGTSSGTIAAVVVIVFLAILLTAAIGFVIWKRRRGENLRIIERLARLGKGKQLDPDENVYAEITKKSNERPTQTRTDALTRGINNFSFGDSPSTQLQQHDDSLYAEADISTTNAPANAEGYLMPVDIPLYLELQPPNENINNGKNKQENVLLNSLPDGDSEASDAHLYDVLEAPNDQSMKGNADETSGTESDAREDFFTKACPAAATRPSAAGIGPVSKKRRRPPNPPRKGHEVPSSSDNRHGRLNTRIDQHGADYNGLDNDYKDNIYESLKEDERVLPIYEPLDKTNVIV